MGDPKKLRKKYEPPSHPWQKVRIEEEKILKKKYGLKNKKEIWGAKKLIRKYIHLAREMVGIPADERKEEEEKLLNKLVRMGLLKKDQGLDDVLSLKVEDLLERRLQTQVYEHGKAETVKHSRQLITHGHISLDGRKVTAPGMTIDLEMENQIGWYGKPLKIKPRPKVEVEVPKPKVAEVVEAVEEKVEKPEVIEAEAKCSECGKTFKTERGLKLHMSKSHKGEKK